MKNKINTFIGCDSAYNSAELAIFGVPYDGTASFRPGARFGPAAMRNDSIGIETYSPYQDKDLLQSKVFDCGDLDIPFGNTRKVLQIVKAHTKKLLKDGKIPVMLGGEHLVTLGSFSAVQELYPDISIVHFDAHADLREQYLGEKLSHSTVMRRIWEIVGDGRIFQFGIRSGEKSEFEFGAEHTELYKYSLDAVKDMAAKLNNRPVYFSLDLDVLDPSVFCGTGTPEAGGVTFKELLEAVLQLRGLNIVACDVNELAPQYDQSGVSTAVACKILREILLMVQGG